jgi:pilus assembly protein FimV
LNNDLTTFEDEVVDDQQNNESIDFDLTTFATDVTTGFNANDGCFASNKQEIKDNEEFESFDFDLSPNDSEKKENDGIDITIVDDTDGSYHGTDFLTDKSSGLKYSFANDFFNGDYDHDFDSPDLGLIGQDFDQQDKFDVFDLTDMDQLETKLDLAKAYIDMSDVDAAKDMAWEVLENGTVEQKNIAQSLLNDLES